MPVFNAQEQNFNIGLAYMPLLCSSLQLVQPELLRQNKSQMHLLDSFILEQVHFIFVVGGQQFEPVPHLVGLVGFALALGDIDFLEHDFFNLLLNHSS